MPVKSMVFQDVNSVSPITTSHGVGNKRVLCSREMVASALTQLAVTELKAGEHAEMHIHPTMDEHFIVLEGECEITVENVPYICCSMSYLLVPSGAAHSMRALLDSKLITIGIAKEG